MDSTYLTITLINLAVIVLGAVALSRRLNVWLLSPATAGLFGAGLIFVLRPLTLTFWPDAAVPHLREMSFADQLPGLAMFALAMVVWISLTLLLLNRTPRKQPPEPRPRQWSLDLLAFALYLGGILAWMGLFTVYVLAAGKLSSPTRFFHRADAPGLIITPIMATLVFGSCLIAYRIALRRGSIRWFALVQIVLMIGTLGLGGRGAAFSVLLVPMLVYLATKYQGVRWRWAVMLVVALLTLGGVIWTVRRGMERSQQSAEIVLLGLSYSLGCPYDYYQGIVEVTSREPDKRRHGQTYAFFFLRPLRGFERLNTSTEAPGPGTRALMGEPPTGGVPATMLGEGFWNFGLAGIIMAATGYGCFIGLCEWLTRSRWLPIRAVWQIYLSMAGYAAFKGWFQQVMSNQIPVWTFLVVVSLLVGSRAVSRSAAARSTESCTPTVSMQARADGVS